MTIAANAGIGMVALSVADLNRSLDYYQGGIGLTLLVHDAAEAVLGAGATPLLRLSATRPGARVVRRATGLYHFALRVPSRLELARTLQHLHESSTPIGGASDHLVSEALYLSDPDGHGIEIYRDRPRDGWYDERGALRMTTDPLDVAGLMGELAAGTPAWNGLHQDTDMGHIHLQVADVDAARHFYVDVLGFTHMANYPSASFVGAGGYHHHVGMNSWMGAGAPPPPTDAARLLWYEICLPHEAALAEVVERVETLRWPIEAQGDAWLLRDPSQNMMLLRVAAG